MSGSYGSSPQPPAEYQTFDAELEPTHRVMRDFSKLVNSEQDGKETKHTPVHSASSDVQDMESAKPLLDDKPEHLEDVGTNSTPRTWILVIKSYVGSGLMGIPFAFLQGGIWPGLATLIIIALVSAYCIRLLTECRDALFRAGHHRYINNFEGIGQAIMGRFGRWSVLFSLVFTQLGFSIAYIIFVAQNLTDLVPHLTAIEWTLVVFPLFALTVLPRRWRHLAPLSLLAFSAIIFTVGVVVYYSLSTRNILVEHGEFRWKPINHVDPLTLPIFFGITVYIFEGIGLVIPMKKAMKHPQYFERCLYSSYVVLVVWFFLFGSIGYLRFGDHTNQIIILNIPSSWVLSLIVRIAMMIALYLSYPVQMFPVVEIVENALLKPDSRFLGMKRNVIRVLLSLGTTAVAIAIPHFGLFMSLIGSFGSSMLMFILPTLFYIRMFQLRSHPALLVLNVFILVVGIAVACLSTAITIKQIAALY